MEQVVESTEQRGIVPSESDVVSKTDIKLDDVQGNEPNEIVQSEIEPSKNGIVSNAEAATLESAIESMWKNESRLVHDEFITGKGPSELPFSRVKKIIKSTDSIKTVSSEVPHLVSRACGIFITELTITSRFCSNSSTGNITKDDVGKAIRTAPAFDYLIDILSEDTSNGYN